MTVPKRLYRKAKSMLLHGVSPLLASSRQANVAMFHIGRVGSTVVAELLNQHSEVDWAGEFHHPRSVELWSSHLAEEAPLRRLRMRMALAGLHVFGFETKFIDGQDLQRIGYPLEKYIENLKSIGFDKFILFERKNVLRRFISKKVGEKRKQWHNRGEETKVTKIKLDVENIEAGNVQKSLFKWIDSIKTGKSKIKESLRKEEILKINYEDHVLENPKKSYRKICSFIDLKPERVSVTTRKSNPFPVKKMLLNYQEVLDRLKNTEHEWMVKG